MTWTQQLQLEACWQVTLAALGAYALGCFTTGYYLVRWRTRQDVRDTGSGNVGARNVGRLFGPAGFVITLAGDALKGGLAVWLARRFGSPDLALVAMLAVVVGHIWPLQLRGRGGKGIATAAGAILALDATLAVAWAAWFAILFVASRKTVWPGLASLSLLPATSWYLGGDAANIFCLLALTGIVLVAHRRNLVEEFLRVLNRKPHTKPTRL